MCGGWQRGANHSRDRSHEQTPAGNYRLLLDFTEEVRHFFDSVDSGARPQTDGQVARQLMKVVQDAYREAELTGAN